MTVLLVWADPLLTLVCGLDNLDGVEHQVDFVGSRDHSGQIGLESMTHTHTHTHIYIYIEREKESERDTYILWQSLMLCERMSRSQIRQGIFEPPKS